MGKHSKSVTKNPEVNTHPREMMRKLDSLKKKGEKVGGEVLVSLIDGSRLRLKELKGGGTNSWTSRAFDAVVETGDDVTHIWVEYDSSDPIWSDHEMRIYRPQEGESQYRPGFDHYRDKDNMPEWVPELMGRLVTPKPEAVQA